MSIVVRLHSLASGEYSDFDGEYLIDCDVDAMDGLGIVRATPNREEATKFKDVPCAYAYLKRQSTVRPYRLDGKPNRPLTAFNVEIQKCS